MGVNFSGSVRPGTPRARTPVSIEDDVEALISDWHDERPGVDMSSLRVFLPLRRALQAAEARRGRLLAAHDITPATLDLLVAMRRAGPPYVRTPSELARLLVLTAGGVSQRLERLEQAGLLEREINTEDRRSIRVKLTPLGLRTLDELIDDYMDHEEQLLHGLSDRQRQQLSRLLAHLNASIRSAPEPG